MAPITVPELMPSSSKSGSSTGSHSRPSPATTPEPASPALGAQKDDVHIAADDVEPWMAREYYDESVLPAVPKIESIIEEQGDDQGTPDQWVKRDGRILRLAGKHPLNAEAPLDALRSSGFLTPQNLIYVRNHGICPQVTEEQGRNWKLRIHGLVEREMEFTIDDLKSKFPTVTIPMLLVCAGNRRKELNMVQKSLGFGWGAGGLGNGLFTGVLLADVLEYCKPINPLYAAWPQFKQEQPGRARHVIFEGIDNLPKGKYGTSQRLKWCMDRTKGMMICWGINGEPLTPDHGYPLRLVCPGQIGGRMIKWMDRIEVSDRESQHYLNFHDNKELPMQVDAETARKEDEWWHDPRYAIYDLNINSAMLYPDHNTEIPVGPDAKQTVIPLEGYAYTGGGRRITRVEISLDDGQTWQVSEIAYPEDLYRLNPIKNHPYYGTLDRSMSEMAFCWCQWKLELPASEFIDRDVRLICVRAMDEALAVQGRDLYFSAMGMMNNWWFRVGVHNENGKLRFEHPTTARMDKTGWMLRMLDEGKNVRWPDFGGPRPDFGGSGAPAAAAGPKKNPEDAYSMMLNPAKKGVVISKADLEKHSGGENPEPWFVVHGHVFDGTPFLAKHPAGASAIQMVAGDDATEDFMAIHSTDTKKMMQEFHLGILEGAGAAAAADQEAPEDPTKPFLEQKRWKKTRLVEKKIISHDTRIFRFALGHQDQELGLPVGQHVYIRVRQVNKQNGEMVTVQRAYTPYSGNWQRGYLDILIKVYFPDTANPTTPFAGGKMTMLLENMPVDQDLEEGMSVELKGPLGEFTYLGDGQVKWKPTNRVRKVRKLAMIAGGSGITPIWSTLRAIADEVLESPSKDRQPIQVWVVYGNRTVEDILIKEELDKLSRELQGALRIWHVISAHDGLDTNWKQGRGFITADCLRHHLPPPPPPTVGDELEDTLALVCGPPPMEKAVSAALKEIGWDLDKNVVYF